MKRKDTDAFLAGVLAALGIVYAHDAGVLAEEIVSDVGPCALLRVARKEDDCYLPNLRKTIKSIRERNPPPLPGRDATGVK